MRVDKGARFDITRAGVRIVVRVNNVGVAAARVGIGATGVVVIVRAVPGT